MTEAQKAEVLQRLYFVLHETALLQADNADTQEQASIIQKEANKFMTRISELEDVIA
jgi:hypothetical protein